MKYRELSSPSASDILEILYQILQITDLELTLILTLDILLRNVLTFVV